MADGELARVNKRKRQKAPKATIVDRHIRETRAIFKLAHTASIIVSNPFDKLATGNYKPKEWHYVSSEEFARLIEACRPAWRIMLGLARCAALREEEALQLPWRCVDFEKRRLSVVARVDWQPKDGENRVIPFGEDLYDLLRVAREANPIGEMVVPRGVITTQNTWRDFGHLFKRAGVERYAKPMHSHGLGEGPPDARREGVGRSF